MFLYMYVILFTGGVSVQQGVSLSSSGLCQKEGLCLGVSDQGWSLFRGSLSGDPPPYGKE